MSAEGSRGSLPAAEELLAELKRLRPIGQTADAAPTRKVQVAGTKVTLRRWAGVAAIAAVLIVGWSGLSHHGARSQFGPIKSHRWPCCRLQICRAIRLRNTSPMG